jgi:hypothetical protein
MQVKETEAFPGGEKNQLFTETQNYWVFGLCPSSGILGTRKHNISETGSVFRPQARGWRKTCTQLGPLEGANLNHWTTLVRFITAI